MLLERVVVIVALVSLDALLLGGSSASGPVIHRLRCRFWFASNRSHHLGKDKVTGGNNASIKMHPRHLFRGHVGMSSVEG